jgi:hypothetical protein
MNLVACDAPAGVLDEAPRTALRQDTSTEHWDGFWGDDDRYYARCTSSLGVAWYCFDDGIEAELALPTPNPKSLAPVRVFPRRRAVVFRVGQGCIVGVRRAVRRPAPRAASRARSSDFSA